MAAAEGQAGDRVVSLLAGRASHQVVPAGQLVAVNGPLRRAQVAGEGDRRRHADLLDVRHDRNAERLLRVLDVLLRDRVLVFLVLFRLQILRDVAAEERDREEERAGAFGRAVRDHAVQAVHDVEAVLQTLVVLLARVVVAFDEDRVVLYPQFLGRAVHAEIDRGHGYAELAGVGELQVLLRDHLPVAHVEDVVRDDVGNDFLRVDLLISHRDAGDAPVLVIEKAGDLAVVPDLAAVLLDHVHEGRGELVRAVVRHRRAVVHVVVEHVQEMHRVQFIRRDAQIAPVGVDEVLCLFRHAERGHDLLHAVARDPHEVRVLQEHRQALGFPLHRVNVVDGGVDLAFQHQEGFDALLTAGHRLVQRFAEGVDPGLERHVIAVFALQDRAENVVLIAPFDLRAETFEDLIDRVRLLFRAHAAELVQGRLKFKTPPPEARCAAARQVVLLQKQRFTACLGGIGCRRETAVAGAHDDHVKLLIHMVPPFLKIKLCIYFFTYCFLLRLYDSAPPPARKNKKKYK